MRDFIDGTASGEYVLKTVTENKYDGKTNI